MSVTILAVDTTGDRGSIALVSQAGVVAEMDLGSPGAFADSLFGAIDDLLTRAGIGVKDIAAFASASGPGSFTGVRIGLTAVKGLAEAAGRPAIAVSNLQALAQTGSKALRAVVIDARRGEVYGAVYNQFLETVREEVVITLESWLASLSDLKSSDSTSGGEIEFITNNLGLGQTLRAVSPGSVVLDAPPGLAIAIGKIALDRLRNGLAQDPIAVDANYVRRSDAELLWKDPWEAKGSASR